MNETPEHGLSWHRSSFCADQACVEVAAQRNHVYLRNTADSAGIIVRYTRAEWEAFVLGMKAGDFDTV